MWLHRNGYASLRSRSGSKPRTTLQHLLGARPTERTRVRTTLSTWGSLPPTASTAFTLTVGPARSIRESQSARCRAPSRAPAIPVPSLKIRGALSKCIMRRGMVWTQSSAAASRRRSRVIFTPGKDRRLQSRHLDRPATPDAEQDLLFRTHLAVAAGVLAGNAAIVKTILGNVGTNKKRNPPTPMRQI